MSTNKEYVPIPATGSVSSSPSKPEDGLCVADLSEEAGGRSCDSPDVSSTGSHEESIEAIAVTPGKIITDEMVAEEKQLYTQGVEEEEKRMKEEADMLHAMTDRSREQRYERLKFLLSKSTMYTEYLVSRIKKQKEEEEKRKERLQKRKLKKEQELKTKQAQSSEKLAEGEQEKEISQSQTRASTKRKQGEDEIAGVSTKPKAKRQRQRKNGKATSSPLASGVSGKDTNTNGTEKDLSTETGNEMDGSVDKADPIKSDPDEAGANMDDMEDEPELVEKAATFGVTDREEKRMINGEVLPFLQPKLMDGGVLRSYQVEGYSWLKVLYENGVNGILADEMGLGKTIQCVAILSHLVYMGVPGPFLVCAPLSTIPNWFAEFKRFAPKVPTVLYHGNKDSRAHLAKGIRKKHKIREGVLVHPVVITSYEIAMIDRKFLANHEWKYLIVDEGHRIKNTHCRLIRELRMYRTTHRLLLTGTPLQNNLAELWSLLNFLLPEIFDDLGSFEAWFDVGCISDTGSEEKIVKQERADNILNMLHQILTPFMLRRLKTDVDLNIPPKKEVLVYAPMTPQQRDFYSALVDRTIFSFLDKKNKVEEKVEVTATGRPKRRSASNKVDYAMYMETEKEKKSNKTSGEGLRRWKDIEQEENELESWVQAVSDVYNSKSGKEEKLRTSQVTIKMRNVMMQLRKCCNHPFLLEHPLDPKTGELALTEDVVNVSGKMLVLDRMLKELKKRGHRVLIFSQMTRMLDLIEDFCQIRGYDFCRLDGSTHVDDRRDSMHVFNESSSDKFLFLLSTRAGGLGINLTGADTVIIYDSDWNPQCDLQAQDRCHRIGQTKPVVVYRFVTAKTIDQKIIERAAAKRKLEKMIIHKGKFKTGNFSARAKPISPEELRDLLQSKDHDIEVQGEDFVISQAQMDSLLDRSDLYAKWKKAPEQSDTEESQPKTANTAEKVKSPKSKTKRGKIKTEAPATPEQSQSLLFKVIEEEEESMATSSVTSDDNKETDSQSSQAVPGN